METIALNVENVSCHLNASLLDASPSGEPSGAATCGETISALLGKYAIGSLLVFIIFLSISGNLLVCVAIYTDRRLRKLGNLFLASLAVADLVLSSLVMTFAVANDMMGYWFFGEKFCEVWIAFDILCCTASILNLCAISLDRFIHIKNPLRYEQLLTKNVVCASVACIWLLSGLVSFLPISLGWHRPPVEPAVEAVSTASFLDEFETTPVARLNHSPALGPDSLPQCALDLTPVYAVVSSSISFYMPCLIMVALYTRLYLYARKHVKNIRSQIAMPQSYEQNALTENHNHQKQHLKDHKAAITLGIIMGVFLVCWVPFFCINIIASFCKTCIPDSLFKVLTWLGYFNSAMNPVIYSIFNSEFREAFRRILISYVRNECCEGRETRRSSRSNTDPAAGPGHPVHGSSPRPGVAVRSSSVDMFPIRNKIELTYNQSDGKISAI